MEMLLTRIYPVYCLTEVPQDYYEELDKHARANQIDWKEITSLEPGPNLEDLHIGEGQPPRVTDYSKSTFAEIYDHMKNHCKSELVPVTARRFTNFTFIVIDELCVRSTPPICIVCCDAPDYDETAGDIELKALPLSIEGAMPLLCPLEQLDMTPCEAMGSFEKPPGMIRHVLPNPHIGITNEEECEEKFYYHTSPLTAGQARKNKCIGLLSPWRNDERMTTAVKIPLEECLLASRMHRISNEIQWQAHAGMLEAGSSFYVPMEGDVVRVEGDYEPPPGETGIVLHLPSSGDSRVHVNKYFRWGLPQIAAHAGLHRRHKTGVPIEVFEEEEKLMAMSELSDQYESGDE